MTGNNVKIEKFVLDYFDDINKFSDKKKSEHIYDLLMNCSYYSKNDILNKKMFTLYFTDEQLLSVNEKQKELGYENNLSRFVRYSLFDFYMKEHDMPLTNQFFGKVICFDEFELLCGNYKDELINGKYTSYDLDLLRNNKKYEGKISLYSFNEFAKNVPFKFDFLEADMLVFIGAHFNRGKVYSEIIGFSTQQYLSNGFTKVENEEDLEPFTGYENIVPNTDSFYYLFLYYAFLKDPGNLNIDEMFNENEKHIDLLLKKYTFSKIIKHFKEKYNITNTYYIFDKECIENLLLNNVITSNEVVESNEVMESNEVVESDEIVEFNEAIDI